ncbi:sterol desaturase family protein [Microcoleus sp. FACHB-1515]|uniref:sterol desaturase family protein n=1 Tax=Cyanophyceae TaxID=3028117 RepID=UPI0016821016|nr:sterol desaturase family protein [Microcoleus sp. FACHB-1515]MBD2092685.1 sterol desaturase family protein [Microcoleus sp. FACHB-1515]
MSKRFFEILILAILLTIVVGLLTHYWTSIPFKETAQVMTQRLNRALFLLVIVVPMFALIERFWPSIANQPKLRPGVWTDVVYWFFTPMVIQTMSIISIVLFLLPIYLFIGRVSIENGTLILDWSKILAGYGLVSHWPLWVQGAIAIILGDFLGYWTHRMNHSRLLWDYHAVHHSGEIIDWLSAVRQHPINDMLSRVITASPVMLLGFSPIAVEAYVPFLSVYIALIHANIFWDYGAFRSVFASPVFHRWHHTTDEAGLGKNFSGLFPIFDVIFGTFYMPRHQQPRNFGISEAMPNSLWGQMTYPFRRWKLFGSDRRQRLEG